MFFAPERDPYIRRRNLEGYIELREFLNENEFIEYDLIGVAYENQLGILVVPRMYDYCLPAGGSPYLEDGEYETRFVKPGQADALRAALNSSPKVILRKAEHAQAQAQAQEEAEAAVSVASSAKLEVSGAINLTENLSRSEGTEITTALGPKKIGQDESCPAEKDDDIPFWIVVLVLAGLFGAVVGIARLNDEHHGAGSALVMWGLGAAVTYALAKYLLRDGISNILARAKVLAKWLLALFVIGAGIGLLSQCTGIGSEEQCFYRVGCM